jgi:hypothetical protein
VLPTVVENQKQPKDTAKLQDLFGAIVPTFSDLSFLLPILVLFSCTTGTGWLFSDSDTGWHIRTGEWILINGRVPTVDMFSFTKIGQPWIAWEWLSDAIMAIVHRAWGLASVAWLVLLVLGATSRSIYRGTLGVCGHRLIAFALTWLAMAASTVHWLARPHLVTPLMAALFCRILYSAEKKGTPAWLWVLPPLTMVWTNLHAGFFVGIALISTYAIGAAAEELIHGSRQNAWARSQNYVVAAVGCVLASFVNPYGCRLHMHIVQYLGNSFYFERISEFQSIDFHSYTAAYFETLLILAIAAALWHLGSRRLIHALLLLSWSHLALFSARNIPIFAVTVVPSVGLAIREWLDQEASLLPRRFKENIEQLECDLRLIANRRNRRARHSLPVLAALLVAFLLVHPGHSKALRGGFDHEHFPVEAAGFLSQQRWASPLRLYTSWQWGGYLIYRLWPSIFVFDDGRTDFYGPRFVEEGLRTWNVSPDWREVLERYGINAALVPVDSSLASVLRERPEWRPVYQDHIAVLFAKVEKAEGNCN